MPRQERGMSGRQDQQHEQPAGVAWRPWGPEAFEAARAAGKLLLVDSGATWCHWCHVMDRVTYDDPAVARYVNERFVAVRVDRDRLPEVDAHLQRSSPAIRSGGSGWPLTVVMTPDGQVLYKATFLPPRADGRYGAAVGLLDVLAQVEAVWRARADELAGVGRRLEEELSRQERTVWRSGDLWPELVDEVAAGIAAAYDERHGGFAEAPKFYHVAALELLAVRAWRGDERARRMAVHTLEQMARGGVCDQLGGGFHRYSTDERWHVPHFEKMAGDNAALLALYADAGALTGREDFTRVARRTAAWADDVLRGARGEGFASSQDADVGGDDDGDYFTWTIDEARAVLGDLAKPVIEYYALDAVGDVPGRRGRNVLHVPRPPQQVAALLDMPQADLERAVAAGSRRLLEARRRRAAPAVDQTVFADRNGMLIGAFLIAWRRTGDDALRDSALRNLEFVLGTLRQAGGAFAHYRRGDGTPAGVGLLADQAWMLRALLAAHAAAGAEKYLAAAEQTAGFIREHLTDADGALRSAPAAEAAGPDAPAARRDWADGPEPNAAAVAAAALLDLSFAANEPDWAEAGRRALATAAGSVSRDAALFLGGYAVAVERALNGPRAIVVVGAGGEPATRELAREARRTYVPGAMAFVLDPDLEAHRPTLERLGHAGERGPAAFVCRGRSCLAPAGNAEELARRIQELASAGA